MKYYIVDTFTDKLFSGNPAGVCLAEQELDELTMQKIAAESNLAETAFVRRNGDNFDLRWFTPEVEMDLCGHATLASAFVISNFLDKGRRAMSFSTKSGGLHVAVKKNLADFGDVYEMDFPAREVKPAQITELMRQAFGGAQILEAHSARDLLLLVNSEADVAELAPDFYAVRAIQDCLGVIVTAQSGGKLIDFVSRFFAPKAGIQEDYVTGSTHAELIPFWAKRLDKNIMAAQQLSKRGGLLFCEYRGERVKIAGRAVLSMEGEIKLPE